MKPGDLTQSRLKELLHYNPDTGVFTRRVRRGPSPAGSVAGGLRSHGYRYIHIDYREYPEHRLVFLYMLGRFPPEQVDHINGVRDDNRLCNLRECTHRDNQKNMKLRSDNKSGCHGVYWDARREQFAAQIKVGEKRKHIGRFSSLSEAKAARRAAEKKHGFHKNHGRPQ